MQPGTGGHDHPFSLHRLTILQAHFSRRNPSHVALFELYTGLLPRNDESSGELVGIDLMIVFEVSRGGLGTQGGLAPPALLA